MATAAETVHEAQGEVAAVVHAELTCPKHLVLHLGAVVFVAIDSQVSHVLEAILFVEVLQSRLFEAEGLITCNCNRKQAIKTDCSGANCSDDSADAEWLEVDI